MDDYLFIELLDQGKKKYMAIFYHDRFVCDYIGYI